MFKREQNFIYFYQKGVILHVTDLKTDFMLSMLNKQLSEVFWLRGGGFFLM